MPRSVEAGARTAFVGHDLIDVACIAVTVAVAVAVAANERNAIRAATAVVFSLFVPGRCIVSNWPRMATRSSVAVSVLFSLTILTLAATVTLWCNFWHPLGLFEVECAIAMAALFTAIYRRRWLVRAGDTIAMQAERNQ